ncbi:hypothetical protein MMC32_003024 [Xylographa parallela]|nr:hypothetical protein [Xylographa parallela]
MTGLALTESTTTVGIKAGQHLLPHSRSSIQFYHLHNTSTSSNPPVQALQTTLYQSINFTRHSKPLSLKQAPPASTMQLPTTSTILLLSLTLTARTALAQYDDDYHYGLQARDLYARSAAAEVYNDIMGLVPREAEPEDDGYFMDTGLYRREETLQECYTKCMKESQKSKNANELMKCRRECATKHPGQAGKIGKAPKS